MVSETCINLLVVGCRDHLLGLSFRVSTTVKRRHDHSNSCKGKYLIGVGIQFQRFNVLFHYRHGEKHDGMQADMVLEKDGDGEIYIQIHSQLEENATLDLP